MSDQELRLIREARDIANTLKVVQVANPFAREVRISWADTGKIAATLEACAQLLELKISKEQEG